MPRAKCPYAPGYVWHLTHRCHNREYLLKFEKDRVRWRGWLFEARKRYGLSVLNYIATSNHIHLLVRDTGASCISKSMQLIAGRVGQEYNRRSSRRGAFWEDPATSQLQWPRIGTWPGVLSILTSTWFARVWCSIRRNGRCPVSTRFNPPAPDIESLISRLCVS
jgi:REP element-mobilizing transposase RayT